MRGTYTWFPPYWWQGRSAKLTWSDSQLHGPLKLPWGVTVEKRWAWTSLVWALSYQIAMQSSINSSSIFLNQFSHHEGGSSKFWWSIWAFIQKPKSKPLFDYLIAYQACVARCIVRHKLSSRVEFGYLLQNSFKYVCVWVHPFVYVCVDAHTCMCTYVYVWACAHACVCICVCVCVCVCVGTLQGIVGLWAKTVTFQLLMLNKQDSLMVIVGVSQVDSVIIVQAVWESLVLVDGITSI